MKNLLIKLVLFIILGLLMNSTILSLTPTFADDTLKETKFKVTDILTVEDPTKDKDANSQEIQEYFKETNPIASLIVRIIEFATRIIGSIAVLIMIIAGFMFMLSKGNQQQVDNAKEIFKYAIYGLLVTFLSYIIVIFVQSLFIGEV